MSENDSSIVECYILDVTYVPQFICAGTGDKELIMGVEDLYTKIENFAEECKRNC